MTDDVRICMISIPRDEARSFAKKLVEERLVACVNILPRMESFYWWEDRVLSDEEALLMAKTTAEKYPDLQRYVIDHHPYEIPELLSLAVDEGLPDYLAWVKVETERK